MLRFRAAVTETAGFSRSSGFIDDTRAFCSIPARHNTSRRIEAAFLARLVAVAAPLVAFPWSQRLSVRNVPFLTWAGVRGGISVALALALPDDAAKPVILAATYAVVLFTLIVQGSTVGLVARRTLGPRQDEG